MTLTGNIRGPGALPGTLGDLGVSGDLLGSQAGGDHVHGVSQGGGRQEEPRGGGVVSWRVTKEGLDLSEAQDRLHRVPGLNPDGRMVVLVNDDGLDEAGLLEECGPTAEHLVHWGLIPGHSDFEPCHPLFGEDSWVEETVVGGQGVTGVEPERKRVSTLNRGEEKIVISYLRRMGDVRFRFNLHARLTSLGGKTKLKLVLRTYAAMARQSSFPRLGVMLRPESITVLKGKLLGLSKCRIYHSYPIAASRSSSLNWASVFSLLMEAWVSTLDSLFSRALNLSMPECVIPYSHRFVFTKDSHQYMVSCISQYQAWGPDLVGERHEDERHEEETTTFEKKLEDEDQEEDRSQIFTFNIIFKF